MKLMLINSYLGIQLDIQVIRKEHITLKLEKMDHSIKL